MNYNEKTCIDYKEVKCEGLTVKQLIKILEDIDDKDTEININADGLCGEVFNVETFKDIRTNTKYVRIGIV